MELAAVEDDHALLDAAAHREHAPRRARPEHLQQVLDAELGDRSRDAVEPPAVIGGANLVHEVGHLGAARRRRAELDPHGDHFAGVAGDMPDDGRVHLHLLTAPGVRDDQAELLADRTRLPAVDREQQARGADVTRPADDLGAVGHLHADPDARRSARRSAAAAPVDPLVALDLADQLVEALAQLPGGHVELHRHTGHGARRRHLLADPVNDLALELHVLAAPAELELDDDRIAHLDRFGGGNEDASVRDVAQVFTSESGLGRELDPKCAPIEGHEPPSAGRTSSARCLPIGAPARKRDAGRSPEAAPACERVLSLFPDSGCARSR